MSTVITTLPVNGDVASWDEGQRAIADAAGLMFTHTYGAREGQREAAPRAIVEKFLHVARITGLDPLTRQLYCIGRLAGNRVDWSIQTSIDGFRVIAERSQKYAGQDAAEWMTDSGEWVDVFIAKLHGAHPLAARVKVWRSDWPERPAVGIAEWTAYVGTKRDGSPTQMWAKMGPLMLAKCAEALALRKAFPQDLSGLYTGDEMGQTTVEIDARASTRAPKTADAAPDVVEAQIIEDDMPTREASSQSVPKQNQPIEQPQDGVRDWRAEADDLDAADKVLELFNQCRDAGELGQIITITDETTGEISTIQLRVYLRKLGEKLRAIEESGSDIEPPAVLAGA
jgi:phage recombination protein Bet